MSAPMGKNPATRSEAISSSDVAVPIDTTKHNSHTALEEADIDYAPTTDRLRRSLSARQVQMIAIGGTIGTGLFLGTGKSLATGGPASLLIAYLIVGGIVFLTMLSLGEMAAFIPVAGSFCTFAGSVATDLVTLQILLQYWTDNFPGWAISLIFWAALIAANIVTVAVYGELEYWLSLLKVVTIIIFMILGIVVNCGGNTDHHYIGGENWRISGAPFHDGIGGFASVFVTAAFAYGGTESIAITAGETKNPAKNLPRVVKNVFWRILIFFIVSVILIGLDISYNYPKLSSKTVATSPFTLVFKKTGAKGAGSFMNAVIMTSVLSAGNHALFAGARLLYSLAAQGHAPKVFARLNRRQVPWIAVLATSAVSVVSFATSYIGAGQLWNWLQNLVGVSNMLCWTAIGITSVRFRSAMELQGKTHLLPFKNWTYAYGSWLCIFLNIILILVQGWSCFSPTFSAVDFVSYYIELPLMLVMYVGWKVWKKTKVVKLERMDLETDTGSVDEVVLQSVTESRLKRFRDWLL